MRDQTDHDHEEARLKALLASPSYVRADRDLDWLGTPEMRGARLLLEYTKPQFVLFRLGIRSTIVVFGGTRVSEPSEARTQLATAQAASAANPDDEALHDRVGVLQRIVEKSRFYEVARRFAHLVSSRYQRAGKLDLVVVTGGGPGIMEAGNRGAHDAGRMSIGLNITLPHEQEPNSFITPELCFQFRYFALRKMHFLAAAKAMVAFPGGYGTMDELFETLCLIQTDTIDPMPVVLVGKSFWDRALDIEFLVAEGTIDPEDKELFVYAETADEIHDAIVGWYEERGLDVTGARGPYRS